MAGIIFLLATGKVLPASSVPPMVTNEVTASEGFVGHMQHPLTILLLQIAVVITAAKLFSSLFKRIGQPTVMGEMAAGICLGPSLLGLLAPGVMEFIFPAYSLGTLQLLSQIGLILFMFIVGLELDIDVFKSSAGPAIVISHVSIVFPYFLGVGLAWYSYSSYAPSNIPFIAYALFMGIAMSITAFPVLARILRERQLTKTTAGSLAIVCAAIGDVTAWCILVAVVAIAKAGDISNAFVTIVLSVVYVLVMVFAIKPLLKKISQTRFTNGKSDITFTSIVFLTLIASAFIAEVIGIHALFGAFLAGVIMPPVSSLRHAFTEKIEDVSIALLLPLFFAFSGLRMHVNLLGEGEAWLLCAAVVGLAVIGKFAGSALAARVVGQGWKDSLAIGALMNTRGLMELIVLNIGYELGILTSSMFTVMVLMAMITTLMTGPAISFIEARFGKL